MIRWFESVMGEIPGGGLQVLRCRWMLVVTLLRLVRIVVERVGGMRLLMCILMTSSFSREMERLGAS